LRERLEKCAIPANEEVQADRRARAVECLTWTYQDRIHKLSDEPRFLAMIDGRPEAAARGLARAGTRTAKLFLAYLYATQTLSSDDRQATIDRLMQEASEDVLLLHPEEKQGNYSLAEIIDAIPYVAIADSWGSKLKLPCSILLEHPRETYPAVMPHFFSNMDNLIPSCDEFRDVFRVLPEARTFEEMLDEADAAHVFRGTIDAGYRRMRYNVAQKASLHPDLAYEDVGFRPLGPAAIAVVYGHLLHWSTASLWNAEVFGKLMRSRDRALAALTRDYQDRGLAADLAAQRATEAVEQMLCTTLGRGGSGGPVTPDEVRRFLAPEASLDELRQRLPDAWLRFAIANDYPSEPIVAALRDGTSADAGEETGLMLAVRRPDLVKVLLEMGDEVDAQNAFGKTALMYAVQQDAAETIDVLLSAGADPNLATYPEDKVETNKYALGAYRRTPLMYAAWQGSIGTVRKLLDAGADKALRESAKKSALDYLKANGRMSEAERAEAAGLLAIP
jgi:uncharacterized protein